MAVPRHIAIALIVPFVAALLFFVSVGERLGGDLFDSLRESMMYGESVEPIFRSLPPEAGAYRGFFVRHPKVSGGFASHRTVRMKGAAAFATGCAAVESDWVLLDEDSISISEFKVLRFYPNTRCH